jgi:hypothetical protein
MEKRQSKIILNFLLLKFNTTVSSGLTGKNRYCYL